jgi:hypothetical protein
MIIETIFLAGLAKIGCVVTAVKIAKRKKQTGEVTKKEKGRLSKWMKRKRLSKA